MIKSHLQTSFDCSYSSVKSIIFDYILNFIEIFYEVGPDVASYIAKAI